MDRISSWLGQLPGIRHAYASLVAISCKAQVVVLAPLHELQVVVSRFVQMSQPPTASKHQVVPV